MKNETAIKEKIQEILDANAVQARRRKWEPTKPLVAELESLGVLQYMPDGFNHMQGAIIKREMTPEVIATDDEDVVITSELYKMVNEAASAETEAENYDYDYILECLCVRQNAIGQYHNGIAYSAFSNWASFLEEQKMSLFEDESWHDKKTELEKMRDYGFQLFSDGWRLDSTVRHIVGVTIELPEFAVYWKNVDAGYIANQPAVRFQYIYRKYDD